MKKLLLLPLTLALVCCAGAPKYRIVADVPDAGEKLYLFDGLTAIDSATKADGKFVFEGDLAEPLRLTLGDNPRMPVATVFMEEGKIVVGTENGVTVVSGTPANDANTAYMAKLAPLREKLMGGGITEEEEVSLMNAYDAATQEAYEQNRNNIFGVALFAEVISRDLEADEIDAQIAGFDQKWQGHKYMDSARKRAEVKRKTAVGELFMDFTLPSAEGSERLSDYVGENGGYVLLDFWASWCQPCMIEVPYLVEAYEKYHDKGFEIFGVSLDTKKEAWLKCIDDRKMDWVHACDLEGWGGSAVALYGVDGIPASFLIGPDGRIVARHLHGNELIDKLHELIMEQELK